MGPDLGLAKSSRQKRDGCPHTRDDEKRGRRNGLGFGIAQRVAERARYEHEGNSTSHSAFCQSQQAEASGTVQALVGVQVLVCALFPSSDLQLQPPPLLSSVPDSVPFLVLWIAITITITITTTTALELTTTDHIIDQGESIRLMLGRLLWAMETTTGPTANDRHTAIDAATDSRRDYELTKRVT
ncbi:hypothetical protein CPLU01_03761 [Colletotrichum plurivorum]|uniref:Uncharacterized protein n=1 Tax=Colletotrichum plurivorum TaxID=2175906 RepID=A0A8H6KS21_9PEZI|nr:hypothetical protein CPLU01_03761 [Colletotrichum plurivorum]